MPELGIGLIVILYIVLEVIIVEVLLVILVEEILIIEDDWIILVLLLATPTARSSVVYHPTLVTVVGAGYTPCPYLTVVRDEHVVVMP